MCMCAVGVHDGLICMYDVFVIRVCVFTGLMDVCDAYDACVHVCDRSVCL